MIWHTVARQRTFGATLSYLKGLKTRQDTVDIRTEDNIDGAQTAHWAEGDKMTITKSTPSLQANLKLEDSTNILKVLCFRLAGEEFAIDVHDVEEIVRNKEVFQPVEMPAFAHGTINVRGRTVPVMDLRRVFDMESRQKHDSFQFIIACIEDQTIALEVDSVSGVQRLPKDSIQPISDIALPYGCSFISGLLTEDDKYALMIDLSCLLTSSQLIELRSCCMD